MERDPGVASIRSVINPSLLPPLTSLVTTCPDFRLYSVDFLSGCEYLPQDMEECVSSTCEVYPVDEDLVPSNVVDLDRMEHKFDLDGWARWDMPSLDYYDTSDFPESYTGYDGRDVWNFIHDKIEFTKKDKTEWQVDFNRAVRGLHASISSHVLKDQKRQISLGSPTANPLVAGICYDSEFKRRIVDHPNALEDLYFAYMLLLSAVKEARVRLIEDCENGHITGIAATGLKSLLADPYWSSDTFDSVDYAAETMRSHLSCSTESFWKARMRTRELMRITNCVQCNVCRLHGKIAILGLSTAMQILLGRSGEGVESETIRKLHRVELAALLTTVSKFGEATMFIDSEMQQFVKK